MDFPTTYRGRALVALASLLVGAGVGLAGTAYSENFAEIKKPTAGTSPTFTSAFSALDGTDSKTWNATTALTGRTFVLGADGTLEVQVRFNTNDPSATSCVAVARRARDGTFQGPPSGTAALQTSTVLTGNEQIYDGTGYYGNTLTWNLAGWYAAEIRVYDVASSYTVDLKPATQGAAGRAAE